MAWNEKGLLFEFEIAKPFEEALYPDYQKGDSIELFIDTRDLKTAGFPTRFCHHFLILPQSVEGIESQEITRFRTDDTHPLADSDLIFCDTEFSKNAQRIRIRIASEALHGYDPLSFDRLGFNYRINRPGGEPGHFVLSSNVANPAGHPSLWASMKLIKK